MTQRTKEARAPLFNSASLATLAAMLATATIAQSASAQQTSTPQEDRAAQEANTDQARRLGSVTVTTRRREEALQNVPVAVTAITKDTIERVQPRDISDLTGLAPNTFIGETTAVPGGGAIFIRGLGYADVEKTQNPAAGVIVDGIFLGTNTGQLLDAFDIEQVEVNRGPQGIFFGKNTTAGVINVTRSAPTREFGFRGSAAYGSNNETIFKGIANLPLGENGGVKLGATHRETDGYTENLFTNKTADGFEYSGLSAAIDYDLTDWFNAKLTLDRFELDGGGSPVQFGNRFTTEQLSAITGNDLTQVPGYNPQTGSLAGLAPREVINNFEDSAELETTIGGLTLTMDTPVGELTSITAYIDSEDIVFQDFDGTCSGSPDCPPGAVNPLLVSPNNPTGTLHTIRDQTYEQFTQEVRLAGSYEKFDYLLGLYYYDHEISLLQTTNSAILQTAGESNDSFSYFGNLDWNITDRLTVSAGARAIDESKNFFTGYEVMVAPETFVTLIPQIEDSTDFDDVITRFAVDWQVTPANLIYASRSEGFRSGGLSIRGTLSEQIEGQPNCAPNDGDGIPGEVLCPDNNFLVYEPESVTAYEIGTKNSFFQDQLTLNLAYFQTTVEDYQINDVVTTPGYGPGTNTYTNNLPEVEIEGVELEAVLSPDALEGLVLSATLGMQEGEVTDGKINGQRIGIGPGATAGPPGSVSDRTGTPLIRLAEYNYALQGLYSFDLGPGEMSISSTYRYIDDHGLAGGFGNQDIEPGYGVLGASIAYEWGRYRLSVTGNNLTDENYRLNSLPTVYFQRWADDMSYLVELEAEF